MVPRLGVACVFSAGVALLIGCAHESPRATTPALAPATLVPAAPAWPERIDVVLTVEGEPQYFLRAPSIAVAEIDGTELARCAVPEGQTHCATTVPRRTEYLVSLDDTTNVQRVATKRLSAPPSLTRVTVHSAHLPIGWPETQTGPHWWCCVNMHLELGAYASGIVVTPIGPMRLRVTNGSSRAVMVDSVANVRYRDGDTWRPTGGICVVPEPPFPLAAGETAEVEAAYGAFSLEPNHESARDFRAELGITAIRDEGAVVYAADRDTRVPDAAVSERQITVRALDRPGGWVL